MAIPKTPALTTDCVVLDGRGRLLLVRRAHPPFKGRLALPGGFVDVGEEVEDACRREVVEETGVEVRRLVLVGIYSDPRRDPRRHTASAVFLARVRGARAKAGSDAAEAVWIDARKHPPLAFDHDIIVRDALKLARSKR